MGYSAWAEEVKENTEELEEVKENNVTDDKLAVIPLYLIEAIEKRDPFKSFITIKKFEEKDDRKEGKLIVKNDDVEHEVEPDISEDTPSIKLFSLDKYRITGIMLQSRSKSKALIVDPEGNSYFIGKNDEIGNRRGIILEVEMDGLLVREKVIYESESGKRRVEVKDSFLEYIVGDE